ncbi:MFS transporter [Ammoniphilus sp. YIM 78166]|uniref:MFS transporter n=1 Tax=Ammoniphilus sp. YIM 78166 TaxID=1644106 RepID=UPI00106F1E90|nr:MFS transporter [Ammoniphilus sp. YIM 78166]
MILQTVIIIIFGFQMILNITRPIITLFASELGASTFDIGALTAAYAFFPLFIAIYAGKIADKVGDRLPVFIGMIGVSLGMALPFLFPTMWSLYMSQVVVGISHVFVVLSLQNVLGNWAPEDKRDHYYGIFSTAVSVAAVIGPVTGGYLVQYFSYPTAFLASLLISIITVAVAWLIPNTKRRPENKKVSLLASISLLKISVLRTALISSALVLYSRDIFVAYFPLYAKDIGITASTIGWILSIQGFAMVIIRAYLARLVDSYGRERVLISSILVAGFSFMLVPFTSEVFLLGLWAALMGFGLGCGQPLSMTTTYNASPKSRTGEVLGLRLTTNRLSQLIAPVFFGLVGSWVGILSVFFISGAFLLGGTMVIRGSKQGDVPQVVDSAKKVEFK